MPLHNYDTAEDWDAVYGPANSSRVSSLVEYVQHTPTRRTARNIPFSEDPLKWQKLVYGHNDDIEWYHLRRDHILSLFSVGLADRKLVLGGGTGALAQSFIQAGHSNIWTLESSPWITGNTARMWDSTLVVNESINGNQLKQRLRQVTGDDIFDWIIDEHMFEGYLDSELTNIEINPDTRFIDLPELILGPGVPQTHIIHLVHTSGNPAYINVKSLAEWELLDSEHTWTEV